MTQHMLAAAEEHEETLTAAVADLEAKVASLRDELSTRQQSYIRREGALREEIQSLNETIEAATSARSTTDASQALQRNGVYELHKRVLASIDGVVEVVEHKQKNADKDAMQTFRARLTDIERAVRAAVSYTHLTLPTILLV